MVSSLQRKYDICFIEWDTSEVLQQISCDKVYMFKFYMLRFHMLTLLHACIYKASKLFCEVLKFVY